MAGLTVYGLKTCDTCRKALAALAAGDQPARFVDIRAEADLAVLAPKWLKAVGREALLNRRSTTWKSLSEAERNQAATDAGALALILAHPALIKRPVIAAGDRLWVGWSSAVLTALAS